MSKRNEWLASRLVHADSDMMFAGVVVGNNPGQVWVDNELNPSSAIVWSSGLEGFNFMGSARNPYFNQSIEALVNNEFIPFLRKQNISHFEFSADSEDWYPTLYQVIGKRKIEESYQVVYKSDWSKMGSRSSDRLGPYRVVKIDEAFLHECNNGELNHADFGMNYIEQYWGTFNNYIDKGYGYVALTENKEIVSVAVSTYKYGSTHTIGVETLEGYRRQGLSGSLVIRLLNKLHENNMAAWWDCMESNIASQKTAEKAGLFQSHRYRINWFHF